MLDVLLSVGSFPHRVIPLVMVDCEVIGRGGKRSEKEDHRFVVVQLLEHLDIFDWEKSIYKPHPRLPNRVYSIDTLVLKNLKIIVAHFFVYPLIQVNFLYQVKLVWH